MNALIGVLIVGFGVVALLPATRSEASRVRERMDRRSPTLWKMLGGNIAYSNRFVGILFPALGAGLIVVGLLTITGLIEF
jgi:hypothetical protein